MYSKFRGRGTIQVKKKTIALSRAARRRRRHRPSRRRSVRHCFEIEIIVIVIDGPTFILVPVFANYYKIDIVLAPVSI